MRRFLHRGACIRYKSLNEAYKFFFFSFKLLLCGLVVLTDMNTYLQKEGGSFKTFLKENYRVALDSCFLFTRK